MKLTKNLAGASLALVVMLSAIAATSQGIAWQPTIGLPTDRLSRPDLSMRRGVGVQADTSKFDCYVQRNTYDQQVMLKWADAVTGKLFSQEITLGYYPTALCRDSHELGFIVAGKTPKGDTVIETMTAQYPMIDLRIDPATGETVQVPTYLPLKSISRFFQESAEDRDMVESMALHQGNHDLVCAKFHTTGSVYNLSKSGVAAPELVATRAPAAGGAPQALVIPELETYHPVMKKFHHPDKGYVILLKGRSNKYAMVALNDPNKDNLFETSDAIHSSTDWTNSGFGINANWLGLE